MSKSLPSDAKSVAWPLGKVKKNIQAAKDSGDRRNMAVLVTTGALNPVHYSHVQIFDDAAKALGSEHNINVIGGYISPSHDLYVKGKLGKQHIPSIHRLAMCRLAVRDSSFIEVSPWECAQSGFIDYPGVRSALQVAADKEIAPFIQETFNPTFEEGEGSKESDKKESLHIPSLTVFYLCGADHAIKCRLYGVKSFGVVAVGRAGHSEELKSLIPTIVPALRKFYYVEGATTDISSTKIREQLVSKKDLSKLTYPAVAEYLGLMQALPGSISTR